MCCDIHNVRWFSPYLTVSKTTNIISIPLLERQWLYTQQSCVYKRNIFAIYTATGVAVHSHWAGCALAVHSHWAGCAQPLVWLSRRGHSGTEGAHLRYVFRGRRGLFLRPPHVRDFVKEGYFFVPRYEVWGSESPYNPRNIRGSDAEVTGLPSLLPPLAAAKQAEDYKILS